MAKKSAIENNKRRIKLAAVKAPKRARLRDIARDRSLTVEERFEATLKLAEMPRNSSSGTAVSAGGCAGERAFMTAAPLPKDGRSYPDS